MASCSKGDDDDDRLVQEMAACHTSEELTDFVLVSDDEMREAARWLWFETGVAAELSGAAALAALQAGKLDLPEDAAVAAVICGMGSDGIAG